MPCSVEQNCLNKGKAYGTSQESCCDHCIFYYENWRKNLYRPDTSASKPSTIIIDDIDPEEL